MAHGYSNDLRVRVVELVKAGGARREAARVLMWPPDGDPLGRALAGNRQRRRQAGHWPHALAARQTCALAFRAGRSQARSHTGRNPCTVDRDPWLDRKHQRYLRFFCATASALKKTVHASEQDRPDVAAARAQWKADQPGLDATHLVFIDETGTATNMARRYGRSLRGTRCRAKIPHGHWKSTTFIAGLRVGALTAPFVLDGAMDGSSFLAYVEQVLAPTLGAGDIVIAANLRSHHVMVFARRSRRAAPPYASCRPIRPTSIPLSRSLPS